MSNIPLVCYCGAENDQALTGLGMLLCIHCQTARVLEVPKNYASFYRSGYYHSEGYQRTQGRKDYSDPRRKEHDLEVAEQRFQQIGLHHFEGMKTLDIGCGNGSFVLALKRKGLDIRGLDMTSDCLWDEVRDDVMLGGVESLFLPYRSLDAITMFDILEHLEDPLEALKRVHKFLKRRSGNLIIEGPVFGAMNFEVKSDNRHHIKPDEHLWNFSMYGYAKLLEMAGFATEKVEFPLPGRVRLYAIDTLERIQLKIGVPAGIGDVHWIMLKMKAIKEANEPCNIIFYVNEHGPNRVIPYLDMLNFSVENRYKTWHNGLHIEGGMKWKCNGLDFGISVNLDLERGKRIEEILPEYGIDWDYSVLFDPDVLQDAKNLYRDFNPLVILYMCSGSSNEYWGSTDWSLKKWVEVINGLFSITGRRVVIVGSSLNTYLDPARDDLGLKQLQKFDRNLDQKVFDLVGKTSVPEVLAMIREADLVVGMCSGLTIMAAHFRRPSVTLWPAVGISKSREQFQKEFSNCWVAPDFLSSGKWRDFHFGAVEPEDIINASKDLLLNNLTLGGAYA